ncbi:hypothetical protein GOB93_20135 [Acetobacter musti]|uniref:SMODS and SLOG-associating 2TM effector domain-containing protein n=1 Tax=Acetobacter musti TaxID=864732 RepID=A0ABX0JXV3_9PROT|nr:hypothetical protein [Acetobacter musti]NHN86883.1 hypothetical protein [Acetobacter musti]
MVDLDRQLNVFAPKSVVRYIKENPHMAVSISLFFGGGVALWQDITPLAGSLFGAGGALLGAWITELNKRRADAEDKANKEKGAVAALAPELQRTVERVRYILDRSTANFSCESSVNSVKTNDLQADFRPYLPTLYPSVPQVRDLPGEKAIALIRYYDSLNEISQHVDDWWEREGQLAVNIFNGLMHAAEKSLRLGLICVYEFDLEARFPPPYESWGTLTSRIERSLDNASKVRKLHLKRAEARSRTQVKSNEPTPFRKY